MLVAPLQPEKLAAFSLTTLERNPRRDLVQEADLGIHISLLDTERYSVPDTVPPLAPEDAALLVARARTAPSWTHPCARKPAPVSALTGFAGFRAPFGTRMHGPTPCSATAPRAQDDAEPAAAAAAATPASAGPASAKMRERARGARAEVSWLMRTTYIANDTAERRAQQGAPDRRGRADPGEAAAYDERDARAAHCAAVEARAAAALRVHVHELVCGLGLLLCAIHGARRRPAAPHVAWSAPSTHRLFPDRA